MESYKLQVSGRRINQTSGTNSTTITVHVEESNFKQYGSFNSWIGNSRYKADVAAWVANQWPGYTDIRVHSAGKIK